MGPKGRQSLTSVVSKASLRRPTIAGDSDTLPTRSIPIADAASWSSRSIASRGWWPSCSWTKRCFRTSQPARFKNDVWTCDFIHDRTAEGGSLKWLTLVDEYTRECLVLHAAGTLTGADVRRIMAQVIGRRGAPTRIRSDNGSEFICAALVDWLPGAGAKSIPVAAASPWEKWGSERLLKRLAPRAACGNNPSSSRGVSMTRLRGEEAPGSPHRPCRG